MGDHVLDRSTSVSVKGEFVFLFWPFYGLVSVELPFEAVWGTFFDHVSFQTLQRLIKEAT